MGVMLQGLVGTIIGTSFGIIISSIINEFFLQREYKKFNLHIDFKNWWNEKGLLMSFSLPAFLSSILYGPALWISYSMLINQSNGFSQLGIYNAARYWQIAITFIPGLLSQVMVPYLSEQVSSNHYSKISITINKFFYIFLIFLIPVGIILCLLSSFIMQQYGPEFKSGWFVLIICIICGIIQSLVSLMYPLIVALNKMWMNLKLTIGWILILLISFYFLRSLGSLGLALSILSAYIFQAFGLIIFYITFQKESTQDLKTLIK
jgi:O-antigen/teichoic acid export membrane protein